MLRNRSVLHSPIYYVDPVFLSHFLGIMSLFKALSMRFIKAFLLVVLYVVDSMIGVAALVNFLVCRVICRCCTCGCKRNQSDRTSKKHAVIIGYQFAGFEIHKLLQQNDALSHFTFTIIEPKTFFEFTPSVLAAMVNPTKYRSISFPLSKCFDDDRSNLVHGKVTSIQSNSVIVEMLNGEENKEKSIPFDYCFICTGSKYAAPIKVDTNTTPTTFEERCKTFDDIHSNLMDINNSKSIAIIGGGPVGVELMAEIVEQFPTKEVTIIDANDHLCRSFPEGTRQYLEEWTNQKDQVTLRLNTRIRNVVITSLSDERGGTKTSDHLNGSSLNSGKTVLRVSNTNGVEEELEFDAVFRCIGFAPNSELMKPQFKDSLTKKHRFIKVDEWMRVKGNGSNRVNGGINRCIFALGDVVEQPRVNEIKLAHTAEIHAQYVSEMVTSMERSNGDGMQDMKPYHEWLMGERNDEVNLVNSGDGMDKLDMPLVYSISLGEVDGSMGFGKIQINGFISQILKWFIEETLCTMYQRKGLFDISLCGGGRDYVFRVYPLGFRLFTAIWWFNHHLTMWYIRYFN